MNTLSDRFRKWYEYERDCNARSIAMLDSVPQDARTNEDFQKAVDKMAHVIAARGRWLHRLGHCPSPASAFPKMVDLAKLPEMVAESEAAWQKYLSTLTDEDLAKPFEYTSQEGQRMRWDVESLLTQVFGHAWYHRGQIAQYVARLGGVAVDTDYIFWAKPETLSD